MAISTERKLNIAKKSMAYPCIGTVFLGISHARAVEIIKQATGKTLELPTDCSCKFLHSHIEMWNIAVITDGIK